MPRTRTRTRTMTKTKSKGFTIAPVGWRVLVRDYAPAKITSGGILMPDESVDHSEYLNYIGEVMELGPDAYKHKKFGGSGPWCKVGDWIVFGRYAGQRIKFKDDPTVFRFVNDDEVLAVFSDPSKIQIYV